MLSQQRQSEITQIIFKEGTAYISDLAKRFNVSSETIRRDLNQIVKFEKIKKVHGGAICIQKPLHEDSYENRKVKNSSLKREIGKYAAKLICDNDIIAVDSGTNTESFVSEIQGVHGIKIITNSLTIAKILSDKHKHGDFDGSVIMLGGDINYEIECTYSTLTNEMLSHFEADKAFIGATAVNSDGIMSWETSHGVFTRELCKMAEKCYLLADSDKFEKHSFYHICNLSEIDAIITDDKYTIKESFKEICKKSKCKLEIVPCKEEN